MRPRIVGLAALIWGITHGVTGAEPIPSSQQAMAVFAGGCFWCMEPPFDRTPGVLSTSSGYIGGSQENATYKQVSAGATDHYEAVQVVYDPSRVSYAKLLEVFWRNVDPFDASGQFCDKGLQYRAAIFIASDAERQLADRSKQELQERLGRRIVTEVRRASTFYPAEEYHQDYYLRNPLKYKFYRTTCGRDSRLGEIWGAGATH